MKIDRTVLPLEFHFDKQSGALEVIYADGSVMRYWEEGPPLRPEIPVLNSRLAFLDKTNQSRNSDFFNFLESRVSHSGTCRRRDYCNCPSNLKSKRIQEATEELLESQTRPLLVAQQTQAPQTTLSPGGEQ